MHDSPGPTPIMSIGWRKRCNRCGEVKPADSFYKRTRSSDGYQATCRICTRDELDAATARRRAMEKAARRGRRLLATRGQLVAALATHAATVVEVLEEAAREGWIDLPDRLADAICGYECPARAPDHEGPGCLLHDVGLDHGTMVLDTLGRDGLVCMDPWWEWYFADETPDMGDDADDRPAE